MAISIHALLAESDKLTMIFGKKGSDFYPRSPCGERLFSCFWCIFSLYISIHALLAESDCTHGASLFLRGDFYPRSPCGERPPGLARLASYVNFYPRSPCGERLCRWIMPTCPLLFLSTLSLRRATMYRASSSRFCLFLSTLSLRRATRSPPPG